MRVIKVVDYYNAGRQQVADSLVNSLSHGHDHPAEIPKEKIHSATVPAENLRILKLWSTRCARQVIQVGTTLEANHSL
ncbi:hypothetical protein SAMN02745225_00279 [Ferrithrix thermotolerans DSM 19514]|uniref:Uncharacterized protein n=1 Tax=Ferrithrix thermotolerans DSM 19514 TaxID=1121881 RepID=A0A1M4SH47_9ACTN|nr:hypothetical protein SAMN02745225_00279 [Ferrithrix thermotolerans DSM 19514]